MLYIILEHPLAFHWGPFDSRFFVNVRGFRPLFRASHITRNFHIVTFFLCIFLTLSNLVLIHRKATGHLEFPHSFYRGDSALHIFYYFVSPFPISCSLTHFFPVWALRPLAALFSSLEAAEVNMEADKDIIPPEFFFDATHTLRGNDDKMGFYNIHLGLFSGGTDKKPGNSHKTWLCIIIYPCAI